MSHVCMPLERCQLSELKTFKLLYLPYCPEFQHVELAFSKIKQAFRQRWPWDLGVQSHAIECSTPLRMPLHEEYESLVRDNPWICVSHICRLTNAFFACCPCCPHCEHHRCPCCAHNPTPSLPMLCSLIKLSRGCSSMCGRTCSNADSAAAAPPLARQGRACGFSSCSKRAWHLGNRCR